MKTNEREEKILELLTERRFMGIDELASLLYLSPSSIRRDLTRMQTKGLVTRSWGGVILCDNQATAAPAQLRLEAQKAEKKRIAKQAASLLRDHMTVLLDSSTTASYLTEHIAAHNGITVITNNLRTAEELIEQGVDTYCVGGRGTGGSPVLCGPYAEEMLRGFHADLLFFSSFALSDDGVISDCTAEENALRKQMLTLADRRVFLCDHSKFHRKATHRLCTVWDVEDCFYDSDPMIESQQSRSEENTGTSKPFRYSSD